MKITAVIPWLVKVERTFWGEYLFVEVRTDEGVSGWGEITTTTKIANRAVAAILRQLNDLLVGEDPTRIEQLWHKTFRAFTYMGTRGATSHVVSGIDIALWDIRRQGLATCRSTSCWAARCATTSFIYTHPDQSKFTSKEGVIEEIRDDRRFRPHRHQVRSLSPLRRQCRRHAHGYLDGSSAKKGERRRPN